MYLYFFITHYSYSKAYNNLQKKLGNCPRINREVSKECINSENIVYEMYQYFWCFSLFHFFVILGQLLSIEIQPVCVPYISPANKNSTIYTSGIHASEIVKTFHNLTQKGSVFLLKFCACHILQITTISRY